MIYYVVYYFISIMIQHVIHCTLYDITTEYCIGETLLENLPIHQYPSLYLKFLWYKIQSFLPTFGVSNCQNYPNQNILLYDNSITS